MGESVMKRVLLVCIVFGSMGAITNQELFLRANKQFAEGNYELALNDYEAVTHQASAVVYNMGICRYKLGNFAQSLACFKRAARTATRSTIDAIMENSDRVARHMQVYQESSVAQSMMRSIHAIVAGTSLLQWQIMLLLVLYIGMLCVWRCKKRALRIFLGGFVLLYVMSLIPIIMIKWADAYINTAIVLPQSMIVYSGPYQDCHQQGTLASGREVVLLQKQKGWYKIQDHTIIGWVPQESLALTI
jgi:tetratricopeptide (TPR) repeat protein